MINPLNESRQWRTRGARSGDQVIHYYPAELSAHAGRDNRSLALVTRMKYLATVAARGQRHVSPARNRVGIHRGLRNSLSKVIQFVDSRHQQIATLPSLSLCPWPGQFLDSSGSRTCTLLARHGVVQRCTEVEGGTEREIERDAMAQRQTPLNAYLPI